MGVVNGTVSIDTETRTLWGMRLAAPVLVAAILVFVAQILHSGVDGGVLGALMVPFVLLAGMGMIFALILGISPGRYAGGLFRGASRAAQATARGVGGAVRSGAQGSMHLAGSGQTSEYAVTVRRFRVQSITGEILACVLTGELQGDEVRHGDSVRITGRRARQGHCVVSSIDILAADHSIVSTVTTRPPQGMATAIWADRAAKVLSAIVLVWIVATVVPWLT